MHQTLKILVLVAAMVSSHLAFAVIAVSEAPSPTPQITPPTTSTLPVSTTPQTSINPGANTGQQSQNGGSAANAIAAALLMAACMATQPPTIPLCVMGALAAMQSAADSGAAGQSGQTAASSVASGGGTPTTKPGTFGNATDGGTAAVYNDPKVKAGLATLASSGVTLSADSVTMPDGSTVPASAFSSPAAMTAAGLDGAAAAKVMPGIREAISKASLAPHALAMGVDSGGGGGGGAAGMAIDDFKFPKFKNPFNTTNAARANLVAGKTVLAGGEPVGVKMDNIFAIIHRAYDRKRDSKDFIDAQEAVTIRMPASDTVIGNGN